MNYTLSDLLTTLLAMLAFLPFLLAPGAVFASLSNLGSYRQRSFPERLLWSTVLSLPLALLIAADLGRYLSQSILTAIFLAIALLALLGLARTLGRRSRPNPSVQTSNRSALLALLALIAYLLLVTSSLQVGDHLFESVNASDWSVRIPLVAASIRNGVPPGNPFFSVNAHVQPSRYYFYWYALCAQVGSLTHLPARACLAASVLWSALALIAILFLSLRYLIGIDRDLRRKALFSLALCCVMGIDILPALAGLLTRPIHLYPEIEWWHYDRIPSFLGAIVFAPHHIAGMVCCTLAFLVLTLSPYRLSAGLSGSPRRVLLALSVAAICFAAAAGDSTYIAFCFAFVGLFFGLLLLSQRRWVDLAALLGAGALAIVLSLPFLHSMLSGPALPPPTGQTQSHFFRFTLRELGDGDRAVGFVSRRLHHEVTNPAAKHLLALPYIIIALPLEFGFFLFPLAVRIRRDLRRLRTGDPFSDGERTLWCLFLGAAIPALFISSDPTQGVNDLGRHAGLILRLVVVLWSTPILWEFLERLRARQPLSPQHPFLARLALIFLGLGLATQLWQIVVDRTFLMIFHATGANPEMPFAKDSNLAGRYFDLRRGLDQVESRLPPDAVVQSNPGSRYQMIAMLYSSRPFAAADVSCEAAFGGDLSVCKPIVRQLQHLFGGPSDFQPKPLGPYVTVTAPDAAATTTPAAFERSCHDLHLSAVVAQNSDPAWSIPTSWVWQPNPAFATPLIRIFTCPPQAATP